MIMGEDCDQPPVTFREGDALHMITGDVVVEVDIREPVMNTVAARL